MNIRELNFFKEKLLSWKDSIERDKEIEVQIDIVGKEIDECDESDFIDKKNIIDFQEKRKNHQEYLLKEINHALKKIENKTFGLCEETGEAIDIRRLKANLIARYSLEAQRLLEGNFNC